MNHLPRVYISNNDCLPKLTDSGEIRVNLLRIIRSYGSSSKIVLELKRNISSSNWNTAWIILALENFAWYIVLWRDIFWKRQK